MPFSLEKKNLRLQVWMFGQYFPTDAPDGLSLTTIPEDAAVGLVYQ